MADEGVELLEGAWVEQLLDPLASGQLALGVLLFYRGLRSGVDGLLAKLAEVVELLFVGLRIATGARSAGVYVAARSSIDASEFTIAGSSSVPASSRSAAGAEPAAISSSQRIAARVMREKTGISAPERLAGPFPS